MKLEEIMRDDFVGNEIVEGSGDKSKLVRPDTEVELNNIIEHCKSPERLTKDPTEDLVKLPYGLCKNYEDILNNKLGAGYIVFDKDTNETWYAHDITCLNRNFIYRDDLEIREVSDATGAYRAWHEFNDDIDYSRIKSAVKYILEDPAAEAYEVYSDSSYVVHKYGKPIPVGLVVHKCVNRFHRDMLILQLDSYYSKNSKKQARELISTSFGTDDAIVISDGAWLNNVAANSYYYLDANTTIHCTEGTTPSDVKQGVVLAEVKGAYNALSLCYARGKKNIKYYYDNPNILNILKSNKFKFIQEVQDYKRLLRNMHNNGYVIEFIELHPKTDTERENLNKALMYFHNSCDSACEAIADICKRDYKKVASNDAQEGKSSSDLLKKEHDYRKSKPAVKR